nr:endonuclease/exonuclease/phosphatase family protein [Bacillus sp. NTK071]
MLFSWNVRQGGGKRIDEQLNVIRDLHPDLVALQEMTIKNVDQYSEALKGLGFNHIHNTFKLISEPSIIVGPRRYGLLIASKWPLEIINDFVIPWEERVLGVKVDSPVGHIELYNSHVPPGSSNGWVKIDTFEGIFNKLACYSCNHRILCGDFNSPQLETNDGEIITWGQVLYKDGSWRLPPKSEKWDAGERSVLERLSNYDLGDVYRSLYGFAKSDYSFILKRKDKVFPRRFDHCFASKTLNPVSFKYLHIYREQKLSDHSPFIVTFQPNHLDKNLHEGEKTRSDKFSYTEEEFRVLRDIKK